MRIIILGLVVLLTGCCSEKEKKQLTTVYHSTIQIHTNTGTGSGSHIGSNMILTAYHVVDGEDENGIFIEYDGDMHRFRLFKFDEELDLAILKPVHALQLQLPVLKIAQTPALIGDTIYACGYHFGAEYAKTISKGIVSGYSNELEKAYQKTWFDAAGNPGCSGGPVVNENMELVGVVQVGLGRTFVGVAGMNYFQHFLDFMKDI